MKKIYPIVFSLVLIGCVTYSLLDAFVIPKRLKSIGEVSEYLIQENEEEVLTSEPQITLNTVKLYNTTVYIAHVYCSPGQIKTALANDTYGLNITEKTSAMASDSGAVLAINGDYYGAKKSGYVIKNGILYRNTVRSDASLGDLAIYADGTFKIIYENKVSASELLADGVINLFAFGPALIDDSKIVVNDKSEVAKSMTSNPRTAIGMVEAGHYVFLVSDGRSNESEGLTLYELANILADEGCTVAYNLDGGGSSTMYYDGKVINNPTTNGQNISERKVSDIVFINN